MIYKGDKPTFFRGLVTSVDVIKKFFFNKERIIHLNCFLWFSKPFDIIKLTSAFFLFKIVPTLFAVTLKLYVVLFSLMMPSSMETSLDVILVAPVKQLPNANSILD